MITKKQTLEKIESLKNELLFHEKRLKEFGELKSGDMAMVNDCSYSCHIQGERGEKWKGDFFKKVAEVITTGDFPAYNYSGGKERNDTLIRYNGEL